ncbi:ATP-binding protein [Aromatoleum diolicum]|uniref:ATP-binding protein n=1 Tax=Aromatoleum diolicum TaxID=75796 RepID=UPI00145C978B|nr:ATP-binding protein [Aromatoleum diolicum]
MSSPEISTPPMLHSLFNPAGPSRQLTRSIRHQWAVAALFGLAYLLLDRASFLHPMPGFNVTPWNPQPSLAIAFLMVLGWRRIWVVFLTLVIAELTIRDSQRSLAAALMVASVLSAGYTAIAATLRGRLRIAISLRRRGDVLRLLWVVAGGSFIIGAVYVAALAVIRGETAGMLEAWLRFWIGDTVGIVVFLPLLLMMLDGVRRAQIFTLLRNREMVLQIAAILVSQWVVFTVSGDAQFKYFYVLFLPLIWIAARHGMAGTAPAMILLQVGVIIAMEASGFSSLSVFELQGLLLALAMTGFFVAVTVDERQRVSDDLRRTLKLAAAGEMAAAITHELNQPLTALNNYARACQLIARSPSAEMQDSLLPTLDKISSEARRAGDVIRRLRDLFKGGVEGRECVEVGAIVADMVAGSRAQFSTLRFDFNVPTAPLRAHADRVQLELVLRNLLQNAIDALCDVRDGTIAVCLREENGFLRVDVKDNGPGIAPDRLLTLFEPFVTDKANGMGVGLSVSRAIIESHGGELIAEAGPGGRVHFTLPCLKPSAHEPD